jgi:uncharacterized glyoxalase superfamily protein PhnB
MSQAKAIPEGFSALTPHIIVNGGAAAIEFYKKAFGAEEIFRMPGADGETVMYAELQIGGSRLMLAGEMPGEGCGASPTTLKGTPVTLHLYVPDADAAFKQAVAAGAEATMPVRDMFWGDRYGSVTDPFGHSWAIATRVKDLTPEEIGKAAQEFFANCAKPS